MGAESAMDVRESPAASEHYVPPQEAKNEAATWQTMWEDVKHTFTTRDGLIGDYDYAYV